MLSSGGRASKTDSAAVIEQLLRDEVQALSERTAKPGGNVSAEEMESIRRLRELLEIRRCLAPPRRRRWPVIMTLVVTLLLVSFLFFDRMKSADVEMDLKVSEVAFRLARPHRLWDLMSVTSLGVSGVGEIELPASIGQAAAGKRDGGFRLATESDGKRFGAANLAPLELPTGTRVRLQKTSISRQYRLSLQADNIAIRVDADGRVTISAPGLPPSHFDFAVPQAISSHTGHDEVEVDLTVAHSIDAKFLAEVPINELSVARVEESSNSAQSFARHVSNIISGSVYFETLGTEAKLRPAEEIRLDSAVGEIRNIVLEDNGIAVSFHGRVAGMTIGFEEGRSIMPTRLEWLRAQHGLPLLWGTALYLFSMITAALRWWGVNS
jgi:hypothetical protein